MYVSEIVYIWLQKDSDLSNTTKLLLTEPAVVAFDLVLQFNTRFLLTGYRFKIEHLLL